MTAPSIPRREADEAVDRFVADITRVCRTDNGARAALRRGLGRPAALNGMHATVVRYLPRGLRDHQETAYYSVAAMIATATRNSSGEPATTPDGTTEPAPPALPANLGATIAYAATRPGHRVMSPDTAEKRLQLLVRQSAPNQLLIGVVRQLIAGRIPISWGQLLNDLCDWRYQRDRIAKTWLQSYYRTLDDLNRTIVTNPEDQA